MLNVEDRRRCWRGLLRFWSRTHEPWADAPCSKEELHDAIVATDEWIEANQASYNAALPEPFRSGATLVQKTLLFCVVAVMRVSQAFARAILGEVD